MKVWANGARFWGSQVDRIERGFVALGHQITPFVSDADLLYVNDPSHYRQTVLDRNGGALKAGAKVIFNILDVPEHLLHEFDMAGLVRDLGSADAITSISHWTRDAVARHTDFSSTVIYQPAKPTRHAVGRFLVPDATDYAGRPLKVRFLSASRRGDPNKRVHLWGAALQGLGIDRREVALVGGDPGWGEYWGVQTDDNLAQLYGCVDFVLATGRVEGLNMSVLEAMAAGVIPVVCKDMTTRTELLPPHLFPEYEDVEPDVVSVARFVAQFLNSDSAMAEMKERLYRHYHATYEDRDGTWSWAERTAADGTGVARRILAVYDSLT